VTEMRQFFDIFLLLTKIGLNLLQKNSPGVPHVEAIELIIINKDSDKSRPSQLSIDFAVQKLLVGGLEGHIDNLNKLLSVGTIMKLLQRTVKVFSLYPHIY